MHADTNIMTYYCELHVPERIIKEKLAQKYEELMKQNKNINKFF